MRGRRKAIPCTSVLRAGSRWHTCFGPHSAAVTSRVNDCGIPGRKRMKISRRHFLLLAAGTGAVPVMLGAVKA
jgi:hypothetical protein